METRASKTPKIQDLERLQTKVSKASDQTTKLRGTTRGRRLARGVSERGMSEPGTREPPSPTSMTLERSDSKDESLRHCGNRNERKKPYSPPRAPHTQKLKKHNTNAMQTQ